MTTKIAAEALGVNPRTVRAYIERGDLEARSEEEGIQKTYSVSIDSVYALRDRRGGPSNTRARIREESANRSVGGVPAGDLTEMLRDLTAELVQRSASEAELRTRLELTAQAESTLRDQLAREQERADRLEAELREARKPIPETRGAPRRPRPAPIGVRPPKTLRSPQSAARGGVGFSGSNRAVSKGGKSGSKSTHVRPDGHHTHRR